MLSSNVDNAPGPADGEATNVDLRNLKSMSIKGFFVSPATVTVNTNVNDVDDMASSMMHHTGSNSLEMVVDGAEEPSACAPVAVDSPLPAVQKPPGTVKPIKRIATLLKENADLSAFYEVKQNRLLIKRKRPHGYRYHASLLKILLQWAIDDFQLMTCPPKEDAPIGSPLSASDRIWKLLRFCIIGLCHECPVVGDVDSLTDEIWSILGEVRETMFPEGGTIKCIDKDGIREIITDAIHQVNYVDHRWKVSGHDSCLWEAKDLQQLAFLGSPTTLNGIIRDAMERRDAMEKMSSYLLLEPKADEATTCTMAYNNTNTTNPIINQQPSIVGAAALEKSVAASPAKKTTATPHTSAALSTPKTLAALKGNAKLTSFFQVTKKTPTAPPTETGDYFQPFFAKPNTILAPIHPFPLPSPTDAAPMGDVKAWATLAYRHPSARRKIRSPCLGGDSRRVVHLVVKLLQFHENYRPPYYGTWRRTSSAIRSRRPLGRETSLDYDYDSDEDWGEDENIDDAESINDSDGDGDDLDMDMEEETDELGSMAAASSELSDADDWLVPDGYVSDDEGVVTGEGKRRKTDAPPSLQINSGPKRGKYVEKEAISYSKSKLEDMIEGCWIGSFAIGLDPFASVPIIVAASGEEVEGKRIPFTDDLLPQLAMLANGTSYSLAKLYDLFSAKVGRVAKRQFELKLNQIAFKAKAELMKQEFKSAESKQETKGSESKQEARGAESKQDTKGAESKGDSTTSLTAPTTTSTTKSLWTLRPEYSHLISTLSIDQMSPPPEVVPHTQTNGSSLIQNHSSVCN